MPAGENTGKPCCIECGTLLISPDNCAVCHGANAMTTFCPKCEDDCGCVAWA